MALTQLNTNGKCSVHTFRHALLYICTIVPISIFFIFPFCNSSGLVGLKRLAESLVQVLPSFRVKQVHTHDLMFAPTLFSSFGMNILRLWAICFHSFDPLRWLKQSGQVFFAIIEYKL